MLPELHWSEWVLLGSIGGVALLFALKLWLIHYASSDGLGDKPVDLGSHGEAISRSPRIPIEVSAAQRCPCCHGDLELQEGLHRCPGCSTTLHWECHREFGCPILGCEFNTQRKEGAAAKQAESDGEKPRPNLKEKA